MYDKNLSKSERGAFQKHCTAADKAGAAVVRATGTILLDRVGALAQCLTIDKDGNGVRTLAKGTRPAAIAQAVALASDLDSGIFRHYLNDKPISAATFAQLIAPAAVASTLATGDSRKAWIALSARIRSGTQRGAESAVRAWMAAANVDGMGRPRLPDGAVIAEIASDPAAEDAPAPLTDAQKKKAKRDKDHAAWVKACGTYCFPDGVNLAGSFKATEKDRLAVAGAVAAALQALAHERANKANPDPQPAAR